MEFFTIGSLRSISCRSGLLNRRDHWDCKLKDLLRGCEKAGSGPEAAIEETMLNEINHTEGQTPHDSAHMRFPGYSYWHRKCTIAVPGGGEGARDGGCGRGYPCLMHTASGRVQGKAMEMGGGCTKNVNTLNAHNWNSIGLVVWRSKRTRPHLNSYK